MSPFRTQSQPTFIAVVLVTIVLALPMLMPLGSNRPVATSDGLHYIALGDSIPSGNAFPNDETRPCQRSDDSYPTIVSQQLAQSYVGDEFRFSHIACSGAIIAEGEDDVIKRCLDSLNRNASDRQVDECDLKWMPNQVDEALDRIDGRQTLVTITIGANDTGWTDPFGLLSLMLATDEEFVESINDVARTVEAELTSEIERLVAEPNVTIVVTDIYNPFNAESVLFDLALTAQASAWGAINVGTEPCTGTDRDSVIHEISCDERAEYGLQALSQAIQRAADRFPDQVIAVSLIDAFRGHEAAMGFCGDAAPESGSTWIRDSATGGLVPFPDCFHPNTDGAGEIASIVRSAWIARDAK